ncbi:MAG: BON domain-containing protein [Gammaproteobacteria bacterium]
MRKYSIALITAAAVVGFGLAGCHKQPPPSPGQQMKQGAKQVGEGMKAAGNDMKQAAVDTAITTKVKSKLAANQGLSSLGIHVETTDGIVTLTGTVDMASKRDLAGRIAGETDGVKGVNNNIEVKGG